MWITKCNSGQMQLMQMILHCLFQQMFVNRIMKLSPRNVFVDSQYVY